MFYRLNLFILFVFGAFSACAQHPWANALGNASEDFLYTLQIQDEDSLCVTLNSAKSSVVGDSIEIAFSEMMFEELQKQHRGSVKYGCDEGTQRQMLITEIALEADGRLRATPYGEDPSSQRAWSAVFYLPYPEKLPVNADTSDIFNQSKFSIPELPAAASIVRMSGDSIHGSLRATDGTDLVIRAPRKGKRARKKGKSKELSIHKSEVYSVVFEHGEWLVYSPDSLLGDDLSADEMKVYIAGEQDARDLYNATPTALVGVAVGAGAAILASGGLILTVLTPIAYSGAQFIPVMRIREKSIRNPEHRFNDIYAEGYERVARSRKVLAALKGSVIGTAIGVAVYYIFIH